MSLNINIIDKSQSFEDNIRKIWKRNVIFMWGYSILFLFVLCGSIINRIRQLPRIIKNIVKNENTAYSRKVSKITIVEKFILMIESNFWYITAIFLFFTIMAVCKTIYHTFKILFFLWVHVIKPILWMLIAIKAVNSVSNAINGRNKSI